MDATCDLYCYESSDGFETHVATTRLYLGPDGLSPGPFSQLGLALCMGGNPKGWEDLKVKYESMVGAKEFLPIGLPHDGETFHDPDLETFLARLLGLASLGYRFPDHVVQTVRQEISALEFSDAES